MQILLTTSADPANPFDISAAAREGWGVFSCDPRPDETQERQLQRIDCPEDGEPPFDSDTAAWRHVFTRARAGSALHRAALAAVGDVERALIEATCGAW